MISFLTDTSKSMQGFLYMDASSIVTQIVQPNNKRLLGDDPAAFSDGISEITFHERRVW